MSKCILCEQDRTDITVQNHTNEYEYNCHFCGHFRITLSLANSLDAICGKNNKYILSHAARVNTEKGNPALEFTTSNAQSVMASIRPPKTPDDFLTSVLNYIYEKSEFVSDYVEVTYNAYPLFCMRNDNELTYTVDTLSNVGYIEHDGTQYDNYRATFKGIRQYQENAKVKADSTQAFVAMWFDSQMDLPYADGFAKALTAVGFRPMRIDKVQHNEKIDDRIIAEIKRSRLLVADFTGHRGGVYFEAGLALGCKIPVIWTCRSDDIKNSHFDTRQYNHIVWKDPNDIYIQLKERVEATIL